MELQWTFRRSAIDEEIMRTCFQKCPVQSPYSIIVETCVMSAILCSFILGCSQPQGNAARLKRMIQTGDLGGVSSLISAEPRLLTADLGGHQDDNLQPLMLALNLNQEAISRFLIASGAPVNAIDKAHWTPLHIAVEQENPRLIQLLLENGADVTARDLRGRTPLDWAKTNKAPASVISVLTGAGPGVTNK